MVNTFQKCKPPDFKFYLCKLNNKKEIQNGAMLIFVCFHGIKQQRKFKITPYVEKFYYLTYRGVI